MKHKNYDMIVAKAANTELDVFIGTAEDGWIDSDLTEITYLDNNFFLCLPQHKEAVLNILNGGQSQANYGEFWQEVNCNQPNKWDRDWWYMSASCESRIKPKKERRWIGVHPDGHCGGTHFDGYAKAENDSPMGYQIIEIEIEV